MRIPLELLLDNMAYLNPVIHLAQERIWFKGIKLLPSRTEYLSSDYLYLGYYEDFGRMPQDILLAAVSPAGTDTLPDMLKGRIPQYILLRTDVPLSDILNELLGIQFMLFDWESAMDRVIDVSGDLQQLVTLSEPVLGNPVVVLDAAMKMLAGTTNFDTDDDVFDDFLTMGYLTQEHYNRLRDHNYFTPYHHSGQTLVLPPSEIKKYTSLLSTILDGAQVQYLVLMLFSNSDYSTGIHQLYLFFLEKVRLCLNKQNQKLGEQRAQHEFYILDMLEGRCTDPAEIEDRGRCYLGETDPLTFCCIVIRLNQSTDMHLKHARLILYSHFPRWRPVIYRDVLLVYIPISQENLFYESELQNMLPKLTDFLEDSDANAGFSNYFYRYEDIPAAYSQGLSALRLGQALQDTSVKGKVYWYKDYFFFHLLEAASSVLAPEEMCIPFLKDLQEYDQVHRTSYVKIVNSYLIHERSYTAVANELFMHRNNVIYHIRRISEIFHVDFNDSEFRLNLIASMKVMQMWPQI